MKLGKKLLYDIRMKVSETIGNKIYKDLFERVDRTNKEIPYHFSIESEGLSLSSSITNNLKRKLYDIR